MLHKFFIKRFYSFMIIMLIPLLILFSIMGFLLLHFQQDNFIKVGDNTLNSINDNVINVIYSSMRQQDITMGNPQLTLSVKKMLGNKPISRVDIAYMNSIVNYLQSSEKFFPYIYSIYLYFDGQENFLTSRSEQPMPISSYYDKEWYTGYKKYMGDSRFFAETREVRQYDYAQPEQIITIYQRMGSANGAIIINIGVNKFGERCKGMLTPDQSFFYLNNQGQVLYRSDDKIKVDDNSENSILTNAVQELNKTGKYSNNQKWIKIDGKPFLINIAPDTFGKNYLVSLVSFDSFLKELEGVVVIAIAILFVNLIIVTVLAWITTKNGFNHINYLVDIFSAVERGEPIGEPKPIVKDEYNLVLNNILFLFIKNNQMQANLLKEQHQHLISELTALQLQINPHFIFNTLQTMDFEVLKMGGSPTLHTLIQDLSKIMKYALTTPTEFVYLKEELDYLKAYIEIQEVRFNNNLITYFEVDENILNICVFRLMLQPIVENSLIHGIRKKNYRHCIKVKIHKSKGHICVFVIDNGCGMTKERLQEVKIKVGNPESKNIGLTNLNRRLILNYGENSKLSIYSKKDIGTIISFKIPLEMLGSRMTL